MVSEQNRQASVIVYLIVFAFLFTLISLYTTAYAKEGSGNLRNTLEKENFFTDAGFEPAITA